MDAAYDKEVHSLVLAHNCTFSSHKNLVAKMETAKWMPAQSQVTCYYSRFFDYLSVLSFSLNKDCPFLLERHFSLYWSSKGPVHPVS